MAWLERILVPVNFSPCSEAALRYAAFLSKFYCAAIEVLHVIDSQPPMSRRRSLASGGALLRQREAEVASLVARVSPGTEARAAIRVEQGQPAAIIGRRSRDGFSLVVIGRRRRGRLRSRRDGAVLRALAAQDLPCGVFPVDVTVRLPVLGSARTSPSLPESEPAANWMADASR